ncbi:hypothetical protein [Paenibacillus dendritiformis]|uniref:hypothetical protein n=1 Tax=Paenibacillus dendritiformis TaxID=130049 RepID=UPI0011B66095|nr:hypothetical protein [Paenibacillus dendritiformis]
MDKFGGNAGEIDKLTQTAENARDTAVSPIGKWSNKKRQDVTTVVGGVNIRTGKVAVGINKASVNHGTICAEEIVVSKLGGNKAEIIMTSAVRPRKKQIIPVFIRCQTKYSKDMFAPGTKF